MKRHPERGAYDREVIDAILDEALVCHVGFAVDGQPFVIPTIHARAGDVLYLHGSPGSRMLRNLREGIDACVTVTLLDGLVLARSVYNHSMNYRSVVVVGRAREVTAPDEKLRAMRCVVEHVVPGRWNEARQPSEKEIKATTILRSPWQRHRRRSALDRRPTTKATSTSPFGQASSRSCSRPETRRPMTASVRRSLDTWRTTSGRALDRTHRGPYPETTMTPATRNWAWRCERGGSLRLH